MFSSVRKTISHIRYFWTSIKVHRLMRRLK